MASPIARGFSCLRTYVNLSVGPLHTKLTRLFLVECSPFLDCDACLNNGAVTNCGWCIDDATCRGPDAVEGCQQLDTSTSRVLSVNVGSGEVTPLRTEVELRKGVVNSRPRCVQNNKTHALQASP